MAAQWFVCETNGGKERIAKKNLMGQGFETYLPLFVPVWSTRPTAKPFLPGYLFVATELDDANARWNAIWNTEGVKRILFSGDRPAPIANSVIEELKDREQDGIIQLPATAMSAKKWKALISKLETGTEVSIIGSAIKAVFEEMVDKRRASVSMLFLGKRHRKVVSLSRLSV